jgi:hypothetical protein
MWIAEHSGDLIEFRTADPFPTTTSEGTAP